MIAIQEVSDGVVVNILSVDSSATISSNGGNVSWPGTTIATPQGSAFMNVAGAQIGWIVSGDTLVAPPPPVVAPTKDQLLAYANAKQWALATGGYTITVNSTQLVFPTDAVSMGLITGKAARLAQPNPPASFKWQTPTGFVTITAADFILVATQVADFVQTTFDDLDPVFAAIEAESITTFAAVDSAAWPSNVSTTPA